MDIEEKRKIAFKMTVRAVEPMEFINDYLYQYPNIVDSAYLRSLYILLSYSFELILKSRVVMLTNVSDVNELESKLKNLGHNLVEISNELGSTELSDIEIKPIKFTEEKCNNPKNPKERHGYYRIEATSGKEIRIEDFNDIRYDFICERRRNIDNEEHKRIIGYIEVMSEIHRKVEVANNTH